jgi:hypothetical protein
VLGWPAAPDALCVFLSEGSLIRLTQAKGDVGEKKREFYIFKANSFNSNWTRVQEDCQLPGSAQFLTSHSPGLNLPPPVFVRCVIEHYSFINLPRKVRRQLSIRKSEKASPKWEAVTLRTLHSPGLETDWNVDWRSTRLQTTAWLDFSHPKVVCNITKTEWGGGHQGPAVAGFCETTSKCM